MKKLISTFFLLGLLLTPSFSQASLPKVKKGQPLPSDLFVELAKMINPSVVNISTTMIRKNIPNAFSYNDPFSLFLDRFHGQKFPQRKVEHSLGSGFIIRKDGLILTNSHVIDKAHEIHVQLSNDKTIYKAKVIGQDPRTDIALIKIQTQKKLKVAKLGDSQKAQVGEWVAAFGNPYGHSNTLTTGVISAIGRHVNQLSQFDFIQTDASINPGNSGGPLVNVKGEVIGMNSMVFLGQPRIRAAQGIAFAIPSDRIKKTIGPLEKFGFIERGFFGLELTPWSTFVKPQAFGLKKVYGALVGDIMPHSPADKAGIKPYDVITKFNGKTVQGPDALSFLASETSPGQKVTLTIIRNKKEKTLTLTVGKLPRNNTRGLHRKGLDSKLPKGLDTTFGFHVSNYNSTLARKLGIGSLPNTRPIIVSVDPLLEGILGVGDVVLDVNKQTTRTAQDVKSFLDASQTNFLRILRKGRVLIVSIRKEGK